MTTYIPSLTLPDFIFQTLPVSVLFPVALGGAVGYATRPDTHPSPPNLKHPPFRPPAQVFPPVWTALYGLMGYAAHRIVHYGTSDLIYSARTRDAARHGLTLYTIQLALNLAWMPLFYGMNRPILATLDAAALLGINGYLAWLWGTRVDRVAGWLLAPYVAWLGLATYLSAGTGYLNGWDLRNKNAIVSGGSVLEEGEGENKGKEL